MKSNNEKKLETVETNFQKLKFLEELCLKELREKFNKAEIYLVGGAVRDFILKREIKDFDFVIRNVEGKDLEEFLSKFGQVNLVGKTFGVLKFTPKEWAYEAIDFALPRREHAFGTGGYRDFEVQSDPKLSVKEDLSRRDFTINAMALKIFNSGKYELVDPFNGRRDVEKKVIRAVGKPEERFKEDYSRMLRAIRFACQLDFSIEDKTRRAIFKNISHLNDIRREVEMVGETVYAEPEILENRVVSYEVIAKEFLKSFYYSPTKAFDLYDQSGAFRELIPEVLKLKNCPQPENFHSEGDVWTHTKLALDKLSSNEFKKQFGSERPSTELIMAVLFHDLGKPATIKTPEKDKTDRIRFDEHDIVGAEMTKQICERLKLSSPENLGVDSEKVAWLVQHHMLLVQGDISKMRPSTIEKYFFNQNMPGENLLKLAFVDISATIPPDGKPDFSNFYQMIERIERLKSLSATKKELPKPLLNGYEIMEEFNLKPGPKIGQLLAALREEQLSGRIKEKEEAIKFLQKQMATKYE
ncbi:MAG: CCA tRNA nucleotidyltransferase [Patescibacteria group bacterium]